MPQHLNEAINYRMLDRQFVDVALHRGAQAFAAQLSREQTFILVMRADPEPEERVSFKHSQGAKTTANPNGPKLANLLEG